MAQDHNDQEQGPLADTLSGIGNVLARIGIGASIIGVLAFVWFSGLAETVAPSTNGVIHIGSPQIYTRERLVNDRFRERAWLEDQLKKIESQEARVSAAVSSRTAFATGGEAPDIAEPGATPSIQPDAGFSYLRNTRATIREALIENELDDRHDLGSNSLYQFNFGAAIVPGTRTRRVAKIRMTIEPDDKLEPLDALIGPDHPLAAQCDGLREFECAYFLETGILTKTSADAANAIVDQYRKWRDLFDRWLEAENALYRREAEDVENLFRLSEYSPELHGSEATGWVGNYERFFRNLDDKAKLYAKNFAEATGRDAEIISDKCNTYYARKVAFDADITFSLTAEPIIRSFAELCIEATNEVLADGLNYAALDNYVSTFSDSARKVYGAIYDKKATAVLWKDLVCLFSPRCLETSSDSSAKRAEYRTQLAESAEHLANFAILHVFESFSEQCSWGNLVVEQDPSRANLIFRLSAEVSSRLRNCIINSAVRDFGSHPFGKILRGTTTTQSTPTETRPTSSYYRARDGLSSILAISNTDNYRAQARRQFVGVVAHDGEGRQNLVYEKFLHPGQLQATCAIPRGGHVLGFSGGYYLDEINPFVSFEIGWRFLGVLVCDTYSQSAKPAPEQMVADNFYNIPIGLFRFIHHLSNSQRTFSYSVQPSGSFELEHHESQNYLQLPLSRSNGNEGSESNLSNQTAATSIEKRYKIIGFGSQVDEAPGSPPDGNLLEKDERQAEFGWYVFPAPRRDKLFTRDTLNPVNVKLTAVVSVPAWWDSVKIRAATEWLYPDSLKGEEQYVVVDKETGGNDKKLLRKHKTLKARDTVDEREFRVELPLRLDFIRNHFLGADTSRPTLYQLHIQHNKLTACRPAEIVIKGERLWRSTVVTLDGQKASLIQVMPDMRGIVAVFDNVIPPSPEFETYKPTITVWTSEGQVALSNMVDVFIPEPIRTALEDGEAPCGDEKK